MIRARVNYSIGQWCRLAQAAGKYRSAMQAGAGKIPKCRSRDPSTRAAPKHPNASTRRGTHRLCMRRERGGQAVTGRNRLVSVKQTVHKAAADQGHHRQQEPQRIRQSHVSQRQRGWTIGAAQAKQLDKTTVGAYKAVQGLQKQHA